MTFPKEKITRMSPMGFVLMPTTADTDARCGGGRVGATNWRSIIRARPQLMQAASPPCAGLGSIRIHYGELLYLYVKSFARDLMFTSDCGAQLGKLVWKHYNKQLQL